MDRASHTSLTINDTLLRGAQAMPLKQALGRRLG